MTTNIKIPEEFKTLAAEDGVIQKYGKFTAICDFPDGSSTGFFTASDDPDWYVWFGITAEMRQTVLAAVDNSALGAWVMVKEHEPTVLLRMIVYSSSM